MKSQALTRVAGLAGAAIMACGLGQGAHAAEGGVSPYLKGYRDMLIGIVPPEPGLYVRDDTIYYGGETDRTVLDGRVAASLKVTQVLNAVAISYVTPLKILGGQYAVGIAPSFGYVDIKAQVTGPLGNSFSHEDNVFAQGDTFLIPASVGWMGPHHLFWNVGLAVGAPTGSYESGRLSSTSVHHWSLIPEAGLTYYDPKAGWDASVGLAYAASFKNPTTDYDTGDILHIDAALRKSFGPWSVGAVYYAMFQVTPDTGSGAKLGAFESSVQGVGPMVSYTPMILGKPVTILAKWAHEFDAKDTLHGDTVTAAFSFKF